MLILGTFALRVALPRAYSNKYCLWSVFLIAKYRAVIQDAASSGDLGGCLAPVIGAAVVYGAFRAERVFSNLSLSIPKSVSEDLVRQGS